MAERNQETPEALFEMGKRFYLPSCSEDPELALFYFRKAAEAGFAPARRVLGSCYLDGRLTAPDFEKARHWLTLAARQGDGQAAYSLALMYVEGLGAERDWGLAWKLLNMESARGLDAVRVLKERLKEEIARPFGELKKKLEDWEKIRRVGYDAHRRRFIQPWFTPGRKSLENEEFDIWLKLPELGAERGLAEMTRLLELYYEQEEAALKVAGGAGRGAGG